MNEQSWYRYEQLRPDQLAACVQRTPVALWPLGLLEHHGWHLPVGFDGVKAERLCERLAARTGGVLLPTMWWGGLGGHGDFLWTLYQPEEAARAVVVNTVEHLITFGFRAVVLLMGHYPWEQIAGRELDAVQAAHPEALILWGTEASIGRPDVLIPGDHAAREETSYGLALLPDYVDIGALKAGHDASAWPQGRPVATDARYPGVRYEPADPLFAQMGEDARLATAERGNEAITRVVDVLAARIQAHLGR
jgi:creatinine amidohydrolase